MRSKYDAEANLARAKAERFDGLNKKRKSQVADLEQQEEAFKKQREDEYYSEKAKQDQILALKEESRLLREAKEKSTAALAAKAKAREAASEKLDPLATTLKFRWPAKLGSAMACLSSQAALKKYLESFVGAVDSLVYSAPENKKNHTAIVSFTTLTSAVKCTEVAEKLLSGVTVTWAAGSPPQAVKDRTPKPADVHQPARPVSVCHLPQVLIQLMIGLRLPRMKWLS